MTDYWIHIQASSGLNATNSSLTALLSIVEDAKHPPMFKSELEDLEIDMNSANPYLKYTLPDIFIDKNLHHVNLTVFNIPKFGHFKNET